MFICLGLLHIPLFMRIYTNVIITHTFMSTRTLMLASSCPAQAMTFVHTFCFLRVERSQARRDWGALPHNYFRYIFYLSNLV